MSHSVFVESEFWLLVLCSLLLPVVIYWRLLVKRTVSRNTVLVLGVVMVLMSGLDVVLLQHLAAHASTTASRADDAIFLSELSLALYLLPLSFGGIGVNLISHVLIRHLERAEARFEQAQSDEAI